MAQPTTLLFRLIKPNLKRSRYYSSRQTSTQCIQIWRSLSCTSLPLYLLNIKTPTVIPVGAYRIYILIVTKLMITFNDKRAMPTMARRR